ncbi:DUF4855 domain-containing protein [Thermococcus stetteri]|uniref:DUF4855 domain-containing protein n=1 Tax=Thermococcus stetteri TaxID=49900 RepID=UPI001AE32F9C|nr:DUF4855 domain-containing protein [Thermococcus stetteri]MBP1910818.1 hypothetical protein [Thermococcus stetteri]
MRYGRTSGLWYLNWDGRDFGSLMKYHGDTTMSTVQEKLREVGIDSLAILDTSEKKPHEEGRDIIYTGDPREDAYTLSEFLSENVTMPYYVEIPYYKYRSDTPRGPDYWKRWVEVFMRSSYYNLRGFYWNYECPMMFEAKAVGASWETVISELANRIHEAGFEFIWIPHVHTTSEDDIKSLRVFNSGKSYNHHAAYYFDWVFLQPNYYQGKLLPANSDTLKQWKEYVDNAKKNLRNYRGVDNIYYMFECDGAVLTNPVYRQRACDYVQVLGKPPRRAYYYDVRVEALEYLKGVCDYV